MISFNNEDKICDLCTVTRVSNLDDASLSHSKSTTNIVSCKSNLHDCLVQLHDNVTILNHFLESRVQRSSGPIAWASGFCGWAGGIDPSLARQASKSFQGIFSLKLINRSMIKHQKFRASCRNDLWASTSWLQLARRAGWKIELLSTLEFYDNHSIR